MDEKTAAYGQKNKALLTNKIKIIMEKLNVYKNRIKASYGDGLLLVAAHDIEKAHSVCYDSPNMEWKYWEYDYDGKKCPMMYNGYYKEGFELVPNLTYEGEPCIIAENRYIE